MAINLEPAQLRSLMDRVKVAAAQRPEATTWLQNAIASIRRRNRLPIQTSSTREDVLDELIEDARRLARTVRSIPPALEVDIEEAALGKGQKLDLSALLHQLSQLQEWSDATRKPKRAGRPSHLDDPRKIEAIRLLAAFVVKFGDVAISKKSESPFEQFARAAMELATGEQVTSLERAIDHVAKNYRERFLTRYKGGEKLEE